MKAVTGPVYENLRMAMDTLRSNKLRSFLTIIGVVVGVITVMLISSIISGGRFVPADEEYVDAPR